MCAQNPPLAQYYKQTSSILAFYNALYIDYLIISSITLLQNIEMHEV